MKVTLEFDGFEEKHEAGMALNANNLAVAIEDILGLYRKHTKHVDPDDTFKDKSPSEIVDSLFEEIRTICEENNVYPLIN